MRIAPAPGERIARRQTYRLAGRLSQLPDRSAFGGRFRCTPTTATRGRGMKAAISPALNAGSSISLGRRSDAFMLGGAAFRMLDTPPVPGPPAWAMAKGGNIRPHRRPTGTWSLIMPPWRPLHESAAEREKRQCGGSIHYFESCGSRWICLLVVCRPSLNNVYCLIPMVGGIGLKI